MKGDIVRSLSLWRYWSYRSLVNYKLNYSGTQLGLLWPVVSLVLVVFALGTIWSVILKADSNINYYLYLISGYPVWQVIASTVRVARRGLANNATNSHLPFTIPIFERVSTISIEYLLVLPVVLIAVLILGNDGLGHLIYLPFALFSLLCWSLGALLIFSVLVTMRPDIGQMIGALMRLSFLATPIIWEPTRLGDYMGYIWFNPFFAPLEYVRFAFSGILYMPDVLWAAPLYSLGLLVIGWLLFAKYLNNLKFKVA